MDIQQLKLLAARVRALLLQADHSVGHNQWVCSVLRRLSKAM
jgi:hypothetical protein